MWKAPSAGFSLPVLLTAWHWQVILQPFGGLGLKAVKHSLERSKVEASSCIL